MKKGDIILIPFPFTYLSGNKNRPALVLISNNVDVTVAFISTQLSWKEKTDVILKPSEKNGLKKESLVRLSKLATLDKDLAIGRVGTLEDVNIRQINDNLKTIFQLAD